MCSKVWDPIPRLEQADFGADRPRPLYCGVPRHSLYQWTLYAPSPSPLTARSQTFPHVQAEYRLSHMMKSFLKIFLSHIFLIIIIHPSLIPYYYSNIPPFQYIITCGKWRRRRRIGAGGGGRKGAGGRKRWGRRGIRNGITVTAWHKNGPSCTMLFAFLAPPFAIPIQKTETFIYIQGDSSSFIWKPSYIPSSWPSWPHRTPPLTLHPSMPSPMPLPGFKIPNMTETLGMVPNMPQFVPAFFMHALLPRPCTFPKHATPTQFLV